MSTTKTMMGSEVERILTDAIDDRRTLVLSHHGAQGWRTFKSQFFEGSASQQRLWVKPLLLAGGTKGAVLKPGDLLGVTFRVGHKKCMFGTTLEVQDSEDFNGVIGLRWPEHLQLLQRRLFERAKVPHGMVVAVRFWRETPSGSSSIDARSVRHGQLEDLSVGGMRVKAAAPLNIELGDTYRCVFTPRPGKPSLVVDTLARHREAVEQGRASLGFQFVGLEGTAEGRRMIDRLARTVTQFQRARSRRGGRKPGSARRAP